MKSLRITGLFSIAALIAAAAALVTHSASAAPAQPAATSHQWLTGYWHNFDNGSTVMPLRDVPAAYNLVAVAFADNTATAGEIEFNLASSELGGYTDSQFKADVAALQARGTKVIISVGGEKGNVLINSSAAAQKFADSTYALMQEYGFDGVDIDLEHGISAQYTSQALHTLRATVGPSLIITMAPQTIDYQYVGEYWKLTQNISDILTIVNMQYYNSGAMMGCDDKVYGQGTVDFLTALTCIEIDKLGLSPSQVGIGVPAVPSAAGGGYLAPSKVVDAINCLQSGTRCGSFQPATPYGKIGGAMTWSINWDKTVNYAWSSTVSAALNLNGGSDPQPTTTPTTPTSSPTTPTDPTTPTNPTTPTDPTTTQPGTCDAPAWVRGSIYTGGNTVSHNGHVWQAKWWTQGEEPGTTGQWGVWSDQGACDGGTATTTPTTSTPSTTAPTSDPTTTIPDPTTSEPTTTTQPGACAAGWKSSANYVPDDVVSFNGHNWKSLWWSQGVEPTSAIAYNIWQDLGTC